MKKQLLILGLLILSSISYSQTCLISDFSFGGSKEDGAFGYMDAIEDVGVGYLVFTLSGSDDGNVGINNGGQDAWVYKIDYNGNLLWSKTYGREANDVIYSAIKDNDGNFVLVGFSESNTGSFSNNHGGADMWALKIDPSGNIIWNKLLGGTNIDLAYNVIIDDNGDYLLSGYSNSTNGDVNSVSYGDIDTWVVKLDNMGNIIWEKKYGGSELETSWDLINDSFSNNTLIIGYSHSTDGNVSNGDFVGDIWLMKIDNDGTLLWEKSYGGSNFEQAFKGLQLTNGNYVLVGTSNSNDGDIQNGNNGNLDASVLVIDSVGNLISFKNYGGSLSDLYNNILPINNTETVFVGYSKSSDGDVNNNYGDNDIWYTKINNTTGSIIESQNFGGSKDDSGPKAILNSNNNFMIISSSTSIDFDVNSRANDDTQGDIWMFEYNPNYVYSNTINLQNNNTLEVMEESDSYQWLDCSDNNILIGENLKEFVPTENGSFSAITTKGNCIDTTECIEFNINSIEEESESSLIRVYPNPAKNNIFINFDDGIYKVSILNLTGKVVYSNNSYKNQSPINLTNFEKGVYFVKVENDYIVDFETISILK